MKNILEHLKKHAIISIEAQEEYDSFDDIEKEYSEDFARSVQDMVNTHGTWGWCAVRVKAWYRGVGASEYLGHCSYASAKDFRVNSGYYENMRDEALGALASQMRHIFDGFEPEPKEEKFEIAAILAAESERVLVVEFLHDTADKAGSIGLAAVLTGLALDIANMKHLESDKEKADG